MLLEGGVLTVEGGMAPSEGGTMHSEGGIIPTILGRRLRRAVTCLRRVAC